MVDFPLFLPLPMQGKHEAMASIVLVLLFAAAVDIQQAKCVESEYLASTSAYQVMSMLFQVQYT